MKQMEVTEKQIGESTFYIKPFPAFTAVNISGELAAILSRCWAALLPWLAEAPMRKAPPKSRRTSWMSMWRTPFRR